MTTDLPDVPRTGNVIDLDALEAQRREGRGDALEVRLRGAVYRLPIEMPLEAVDALSVMADVDDVDDSPDADPRAATESLRKVSKALDNGLAVLFCTCPDLPQAEPGDPADWSVADVRVHLADCQWPLFHRARPSLETRMALVESVWAAYGVSLGEALAPEKLPSSSGAPSARTSNGSTRSTRATSGAGRRAPADRQPPAKKAAARKAPAKKAAPRRGSGSATS